MDFDNTTESITPQNTTTLGIGSTGSLLIPTGTTAQRPSGSDGMLRYNSSEYILEGFGASYSLSNTPSTIQHSVTYRKYRWWADEFLVGSTAATGVGVKGELGWSQTSTGSPTNSFQTAVADHPGIYRSATTATLGFQTRLHLGNAANTPVINPTQVEYFAFLIRLPLIPSPTFNVGLGQDVGQGFMGTDAIYFSYDTTVGTTIQFFTRSGSTSATAVNTITLVANTWYLLEAFNNGTTWTPVVNGVTYTAQTTNIPTAAINVGMTLQAQGAAINSFDIDAFFMLTTELGARYP